MGRRCEHTTGQLGAAALQLPRDDALVFGAIEGEHRNPEQVSRQFVRDAERCRGALGGEAVPVIRLHDLRHTHATLLTASPFASSASALATPTRS